MPYAEFIKHIAYRNIAPWGDDWKQTSAVCAATTSASTKYKQIDLAPYFPKPRRQSADEIFDVAKKLAIDAEARRKAKAGG
jgi:hypothetical protein